MKRLLLLVPVCCLSLMACGGEDRHGGNLPPPPAPDAGTACTGGSSGGLFGGSGGGSCSGSKTLGTRCQQTSECGSGEVCQSMGWGDSYCMKDCSSDADCGSGGKCYIDSSRGRGACFSACTKDADCPNALMCGAPDGTKVCAPTRHGGDCYNNSDCKDPAFSCVGSAGFGSDQQGLCTMSCAGNASACPKDTQCLKSNSGGDVCLRSCTTSSQCSNDQVCQSGACQPKKSTSPRPVGSACTSDSDCASGLSCFQEANGWKGGYCSKFCTNNPSVCDYGTTCIVINSSNSACLDDCYPPGEQGQCRDGYTCSGVNGQDMGVCY